MKIDMGILSTIIGLFFTILGGVIGYLVFKKNNKRDNDNQVRHDTKIDIKLDYISKNVDEIRLDNKKFSDKVGAIAERVSIIEKSNIENEKRISKLENLHLEK